MKHHTFGRHGFTLIEILIVIAVIAVLSVVVVLVLNPGELIRMSRDSRRLSDLDSVNRSLHYYDTDVRSSYFGSSSVIYVSIPDSSPTCANLGLPTTTVGWSYACAPSSTYRNNDGTGWVPVNFKSISFEPVVTTLPIDPVNSTSGSFYYTYFAGSWELNATLESNRYRTYLTTDGGDSNSLYEYGTNLLLAPPR